MTAMGSPPCSPNAIDPTDLFMINLAILSATCSLEGFEGVTALMISLLKTCLSGLPFFSCINENAEDDGVASFLPIPIPRPINSAKSIDLST